MCMRVYACAYVYMFADILRSLNWALESLELELKTVVICLLWVLGTKPKSSVKTESALNYRESS